MLEAGAAGSASLDSGAHAATAGNVPEFIPPAIIDGQVLTAELQALVCHTFPEDHIVTNDMAGPGMALLLCHGLLSVVNPFLGWKLSRDTYSCFLSGGKEIEGLVEVL